MGDGENCIKTQRFDKAWCCLFSAPALKGSPTGNAFEKKEKKKKDAMRCK